MKSSSLPKLRSSEVGLKSDRSSIFKRKSSESGIPNLALEFAPQKASRLISLPSTTTPKSTSALIQEYERKKIAERLQSNRSNFSFVSHSSRLYSPRNTDWDSLPLSTDLTSERIMSSISSNHYSFLE